MAFVHTMIFMSMIRRFDQPQLRNHNEVTSIFQGMIMRTLTIENIPEPLYEKLKEAAAGHNRSVDNELIHCLEETLFSKEVNPSERLKQVQEQYHKQKEIISLFGRLPQDADYDYKKGRKNKRCIG